MSLEGAVYKLLKLYGINSIRDFIVEDIFLECSIVFYDHISIIYYDDKHLIVIDKRNDKNTQYQDLIKQLAEYFRLRYGNEVIAAMHIRHQAKIKRRMLYGNDTRTERSKGQDISGPL